MGMQWVKLTDARLTWDGAVSLERTRLGIKPWRINHEERHWLHPTLCERTQKASGVRLVFRSNTGRLALEFVPWNEPTAFDICLGRTKPRTVRLPAGARDFVVSRLGRRSRQIEIWFPPNGHTCLKKLGLDADASLDVVVDDRRRWVTYGSSITQCSVSHSPTRTWPAVAARACGLHLTNLGFSGECVLDMPIARTIRDLRADYISLEVGPNIYGHGALGERSFRWSLLGFVQIIREKHPETPLFLMSAIHYPLGETRPHAAGMTMQQMRAEIKAAVAGLRKAGDRNVRYIHGPDIMGPSMARYLPDGAHPTPDGYVKMGKRFAELVIKPFFRSS